MNGAPPPEACLNCGAAFVPGRRRYCPECGQETNVRPPRLGEFVQQFGGAYFSTEGALWRTLALLLFKPGELTRKYLAGRRRHYVLPLRLYLTISLVTLLLVRVVGAMDVQVQTAASAKSEAEVAQASRNLTIAAGGGRTGLRDGVFYCERFPAWLCQRFKRRLDIDPKTMVTELERLKERFLGNLGSAMFLLLPSFALWLKLVYWGRGLRFTEHLVFALHVHAFWFLALALMLTGVDALWVLALLAVPVYTLMAMKRVYADRLLPRLLRAGVISLLYGAVMGLALAAVGVFTLLS